MRSIRQIVKSLLIQSPRRANYKFVLKDWKPLLELKAASELLETKRFTQNLQPVEIEVPEGRRALVLSPHTDDDIFGPGGTLIKMVRGGADVRTVYFCVPSDDPARIAKIEGEAREASARLGATPEFLYLTLGTFPLAGPHIDRLQEIIRDFKPDIIFTTFLLDDHDDHRRTNHLLLEAAAAETRDIEVWAYQIYSSLPPNVIVDITNEAEEKRALIEIFKSVQGERDWAHYVLGINAANCRFRPGRAPYYVEAFFVTPLSEYLDLCRLYFAHAPRQLYGRESYYDLDGGSA